MMKSEEGKAVARRTLSAPLIRAREMCADGVLGEKELIAITEGTAAVIDLVGLPSLEEERER